MRVLQMHNSQRTYGGADEVIEYERDMLLGGGHVVEQLFLPAVQVGRAGMALKPSYNRAFAAQLRTVIDRFRPDVVHTHTPFPLMSPAVFRIAKGRGCATVATMHGYRYSCVAGTLRVDGKPCDRCVGRTIKAPAVVHSCYHDSRLASAALAVGLTVHHAIGTFDHHVDRIIALTDYVREIAIRDGMPPEKIVVKPNSVPDPGDAALTDFPAQSQVVFLARLVPEKGVRTVVEAWRRGGDALPKLVIAGEGVLRPEVEALVRDRPNVEFRGWLDEDAVTALISQSSAVLLPSEWSEGHPLVMIRALSMGRPLIASDMPNLREIVQGEGVGVTFRTADPRSMIEATHGLLADGDALHAYSVRARKYFVDHYSPAANARNLVAVYEAALAASGR